MQAWSENIIWQHFSGMTHYEHRLPCDATQVGRFRRALGEAGVEELLAKTIETAVATKAIPITSFEREGKQHKRKAAGYAHAKQFKRMHKVIRRQRTIVGKLIRDIERHLAARGDAGNTVFASLKERAVRIQTQEKADKNKLYAFHAPEVECISKGKAKNQYEFGVKVSLVVTHKEGLIVGARSFCGSPYDGHTLAEQLEQTQILLQNMHKADQSAIKPTTAVGDLGYRGVKEENPDVLIVQRGWIRSMTKAQKGWLKRRQAIEPVIGHVKDDCRMRRCHLKGQEGDALHAVLCAAGYNIRWLLRAIATKGIKALDWLYLRPLWLAFQRDIVNLLHLLALPILAMQQLAVIPRLDGSRK